MWRFLSWMLIVPWLALSAVARAEAPAPPGFALERYTLSNGLRVVLNEDHTSPNVSICVTYDVGSRNEAPNQSGFAHLFEHMMFQGSRNVPKGAHFQWIAERGGRTNGTTNKERTNYFESLPSSDLALGLWLEADRLKSLALTRANFENQRQVVQEEYRMRYENRVFALGRLRLHRLAFQGFWPYEHPTIGSLDALEDARFSWAKSFHANYYAPNNAVLSLSGDFDPEEARRLIQQYFSDVESHPEVPRFELPKEPVYQSSERLSVIVDDNAKTPGVYYGWRVPRRRTREHRALELASEVLTGGESGRLYQSLVIEKGSALRVASWLSHSRGPSLFTIRLVIAPLSNVDTAQTWLDGELKRLRLIGPSDSELERAKVRIRTELLHQLENKQKRAVALGEYEMFFGDAGLLLEDLDAYGEITRAEIRAAASQFLIDTQRTIVEVYPPGWVRDIGPPILTTTHVVQKGENLIRIAKKYGTTASAIAKENRISPKKPIFPGQRLFVTHGAGGGGGPKAITKKHTVKKGDNLITIAKKYGTTATAIAKENKISVKKPIFPGQELTITVEVSNPKSSKRSKSKKKK